VNKSKAEVDVLAVKPKQAAKIKGCGLSKIYKLMKTGELEVFHDGRATFITMRSIQARLERLLAQE
jgi:hypothetical protein